MFDFELVKEVPRLKDLRRALDETIFSTLFDKTKELTDYRSDYFHFNETTNMALHGEFDENSTQESNHNRMQQIAHQASCGIRLLDQHFARKSERHINALYRKQTD